jgi:hypothetical protein
MDGQFKSFEKIALEPMFFLGDKFSSRCDQKKKSGEHLTKGVLRFFGQNVPYLEKKSLEKKKKTMP